MSRSAFCPRCGDPVEGSERPELPGAPAADETGLCDACYFEDFELVSAPEKLTIRVCARCGAVHRGNRWVDVGAEDYTDVAIDAVSESLGVHLDAEDVAWQVEPEQVDQNTIRIHCLFTGVVREEVIEEEVVVPVTISRETCTRCGRIAGSYYASVVQLRARDREPTNEEREAAKEISHAVVAEMEATGDRDAFVTEIDDTADGVDVKVSTTNIGKKISQRLVNRFGGSFSDSETLVTEDEDGNEVYRVTYAVRLPPFTKGDVIDPEDGEGPVLVRSARGTVKGRRLATGERYESSFEEGDSPDARRLGRTDDAQETTLVSVEDDRAVQVLDPETYESKTIPRPDFLDTESGTVSVLKSRAGLHAVPEDGPE
ncbi:60S ribosomal export protein NMD3 [Halalkalicoccus sp. NIPERK01]|uniref:60S ribosomal export protein NMD3 n=1 Tax=Halalkalicoccus sp. NIPERK01 TaxID=3053469 RepID=UPI00256EC123|nr:60S ribosomal export protein NMD3 [Halalkalicoccus sp. NIPERK01]MDL5362787.1 60S ribosomal export protein NMD3 [Halalkalicoccus sp. NIPERK01]